MKIELTIKEFSLKVEGDRESVQGVQAGLDQTINSLAQLQKQALNTPAPLPNDTDPGETIDVAAIPATTSGKNGSKVARPRRSKAVSPRGLIVALRDEGFFAESRTLADVRVELERKGHNFKSNDLSSPLKTLTQQKNLTRQKNAEGEWSYQRGPVDET